MKLISFLVLISFLTGCTEVGGDLTGRAASAPAEKDPNFVEKSAADIRRSIAQAAPDEKNSAAFSESNRNSSMVQYFCDRKKLPRTCCYYVMNGAGGFYGGSPSCVEENH